MSTHLRPSRQMVGGWTVRPCGLSALMGGRPPPSPPHPTTPAWAVDVYSVSRADARSHRQVEMSADGRA